MAFPKRRSTRQREWLFDWIVSCVWVVSEFHVDGKQSTFVDVSSWKGL